MQNEEEVVGRISRVFPTFERVKRSGTKLLLGIGDDAALFGTGRQTEWVVTTDAFMDGVHFLADVHPADSVGYKALARATSDITAMGAKPRYFLLTLAIPAERTGVWLTAFLRGMRRASRVLGVTLAGGDTTRTAAVAITVIVIGDMAPGRAVRRSGAKPGDGIYVSGPLGGAQLGLELVRRGLVGERRFQKDLAPHLYPQIPVELAEWLAKHRMASAMMDLSDGLSTDLARLCAASRVGAKLEAATIPCVEIPRQVARKLGEGAPGAMEMALHGGDDYALLFTVPQSKEPKLRDAPGYRAMRRIGEIVRGNRITDARGRLKKFSAGGWDPFRR